MIWWRGKGLLLGLVVAVLVLAASRGGRFGVPAGFISAAVVVFLLRGWAGEESSLYSVPVRVWPIVLIVFAGIAFFRP